MGQSVPCILCGMARLRFLFQFTCRHVAARPCRCTRLCCCCVPSFRFATSLLCRASGRAALTGNKPLGDGTGAHRA
eukprot:1174006-Prorocentrum_minimum.AAC.1